MMISALLETRQSPASPPAMTFASKRTALLALTWEASSPAERRALTDVLGVADASAEQIAAATDIVERNGRAAHEAEIARLVADGDAALEASTFDEGARAMLRELCSILTARRS